LELTVARVKPLLLLALFALMAWLGYRIADTPPATANKETAARETLVEARFFDAKGSEVGLDAFTGSVVLVNLWATWCTPCIAELPSLEKLQVKAAGEGLKVLPIALDRNKDEAAIAAFLKKNGIRRLESWLDKNHIVAGNWTYTGVPTTLLLDRKGRIIKVFEGPFVWDEGDALAAVTAALAR
jgi:thiol-disulfide isomerase/thioredoxin